MKCARGSDTRSSADGAGVRPTTTPVSHRAPTLCVHDRHFGGALIDNFLGRRSGTPRTPSAPPPQPHASSLRAESVPAGTPSDTPGTPSGHVQHRVLIAAVAFGAAVVPCRQSHRHRVPRQRRGRQRSQPPRSYEPDAVHQDGPNTALDAHRAIPVERKTAEHMSQITARRRICSMGSTRPVPWPH